MATLVFSGEDLERLRGFPEIGREELFRFFTLAPAMSRSWIRVGAGDRGTG